MKKFIDTILSYLGKNSIKRLLWYLGIRSLVELGLALSAKDIDEILDKITVNVDGGWITEVAIKIFKVVFISGQIQLFWLCLGLFLFVGILYVFERKYDYNNQTNATSKELRDVIETELSVSRAILPRNYVEHPCFDIVQNNIERRGHCVIYGQSFCGKTILGKSLLIYYRKQGYLIKISSTIAAASEFLLAGNSKRMCLLEDPFGHSTFNDENSESIYRLDSLIRSIHSENKLLVTTRSIIFNKVFRNQNDASIVFPYMVTIDVTDNDKKFLRAVWDSILKNDKSVSSISNSVEKLIETTSTIYPGHLWVISKYKLEKTAVADIGELEKLAKVDAQDLARTISLQTRDYIIVYVLMGILADTVTTASSKLLDYVINTSESDVTGVLRGRYFVDNTMPSLGFYRDSNSILSKPTSQLIDEFVKRGFYRLEQQGAYFVHPLYIDAFYIMVNENIMTWFTIFMELFTKCVFNSSPENSFIASTKFGFVYKACDDEGGKRVIELARNTLLFSLYPKVREQAFLFLSNIKEELSVSVKNDLYESAINSFDIFNIDWSDPNNPKLRHNTSRLALAELANRAEVDEGSVPDFYNFDQSEAHSLYNYYQFGQWLLDSNDCSQVEPNTFQYIIDYLQASSEPMVRTLGSKLAISKFEKLINKESVLIGFGDKNPAVVIDAIKVYLENTGTIDDAIAGDVVRVIISSLSNELVAARSAAFMCTFGLDYTSTNIRWQKYTDIEKSVIWNNWAPILVAFLYGMPHYIRLPNTPRFDATLQEGKKFFSYQAKHHVIDAYTEYVIRLSNNNVFDDFLYGVADHIVSYTKEDDYVRSQLIFRLLNHTLSNLSLSSFRWVLYNLNNLSDKEISAFYDFIENLDRVDRQWFFDFCSMGKF